VPRARCPESIEAEKKYRSGMKLVEIAREMIVPAGTVRRWKSDHDWDGKKAAAKKKEGERSGKSRSGTSNPNAQKRRPGAPLGNKNGTGAPVGNARAATHGAYMKFYESVLSPEEMEAYQYLVDQDEKRRLQTLYAQHQITERKLMEEIKAIESGAEMITHRTVSQIEPSGKKAADGREITKVVKISQDQETRKGQLRNFTDALTRVRAEMRRVADSLRQLAEAESQRFMHVSTQGLIDAMTEAYKRHGDDDDD
jgi:uncharacterized protein YjcR